MGEIKEVLEVEKAFGKEIDIVCYLVGIWGMN